MDDNNEMAISSYVCRDSLSSPASFRHITSHCFFFPCSPFFKLLKNDSIPLMVSRPESAPKNVSIVRRHVCFVTHFVSALKNFQCPSVVVTTVKQTSQTMNNMLGFFFSYRQMDSRYYIDAPPPPPRKQQTTALRNR